MRERERERERENERAKAREKEIGIGAYLIERNEEKNLLRRVYMYIYKCSECNYESVKAEGFLERFPCKCD